MPKKKSDLDRSIEKWKKKNPELAVTFDDGYESFKVGVLLKQAREDAGLSQTELDEMINTKRTAISRLENHAMDVKLSTIDKVARALGKHLEVHLT
jgi:ribosome-binding protein aMBF1 (putative translation factor)